MAHDVFISYAGEDRAAAEEVCSDLERNGLRCWMAPRDIAPGANWGNSIIEAIGGARALVLILSAHANGSKFVQAEVERATNKDVPVIPLRLEEVKPSAGLELFVSARQWLNAFPAPLGSHLEKLRQTLRAIVSRDAPAGESAPVVQLFRPKVYLSAVGAAQDILDDVLARLNRLPFAVEKPHRSGYWTDQEPEFYKQFDLAIMAFGSSEPEIWRHAFEEDFLLHGQVFVYFEPVAMMNTGYGAPATGHVLHLEDWRRRPDRCLKELVAELCAVLKEKGWTVLREDLPAVEIVSFDGSDMQRYNWRRPLERAGFDLPPLSQDRSEIGKAKISLFVVGEAALTPEQATTILDRVHAGSGIVTIVKKGYPLPEPLQSDAVAFDLAMTDVNESPVGTDGWERMISAIDETLKTARRALAAAAG